MLITKLKPDYFGKISGKEILLKPGINLIYGENEAGKSTLHTFIKGMLFGIERLRGRGAASKEDIYTRYLPWDYPGAYKGQMDILVGEKNYRLQRSFHANDRYFTIFDLDTGREIKLKEGHISELIPGLNEAAFRNTISIEQLKAETDGELAVHVRNYITNLSITKSREVNVEKAVGYLKEKKKALESIPYAQQLKSLAKEIEEGIKKEEKIDFLTASLRSMEDEKTRLKEQLDILKTSENQKEEKLMDELPAIIEKYRTYKEFINQYAKLEHQIEELKIKLTGWENEAKKATAIKNDYNEIQMLETKCIEYQEILKDLYKEQEEKNRSKKQKGLLYIIISIATVLTVFNITKSYGAAFGILSVLFIIGGILYILSNKKQTVVRDNEARINEIKNHYSEAEARINQVLNTYQVTSLFELAKKQEEYLKITVSMEHGRELLSELNERIKSLEDNCDELHDTIMLYMRNFITEEELTPAAVTRLQDFINNKKKETEIKQSELKARLDNINLQIEKIRWQLSNMEDNETHLIKNKEQYDELLIKHKENDIEISAINLAIDTIRELSVTIHDSFGKELNRAVSEIISEVTNGKYQDLKIDEKLNIKLEWNDDYIILDRLSAGTIDQVYFALRLAVSDLLLGKNNMPLILDDSFALYDDKRIKSALMKIADRSQVLIFSCQMREKTLLQELGLPFNFIKL